MRPCFVIALAAAALTACTQTPPPVPPAAAPQAQAPAPQARPINLRGSVRKLDGNLLTVRTREGKTVVVALAPNVDVRAVLRRKLSDIKPGDYVASTSVPGKDGKLHALEVHILPERMRGLGEGQFPYDLAPNSLMTNATVQGVVRSVHGITLTVVYKGQTAVVVVGPKTPIVTYGPGDVGLLKPGKAVMIAAAPHPDGSLTALRINAEKNGVKPPM
ncbi:MAG TPA: hypothetical protein VFC38_11090 [Stellaceae bacterium]|nr:hypothetical protein [Stellaceae bacterium]